MKIKRAFLLLVILLCLNRLSYSTGEAATTEILPVLHSDSLTIPNLNMGSPEGLVWDGQRLLASFPGLDLHTGLYGTDLYEIDAQTFWMDEFPEPVVRFPHSSKFLTWNGKNFLSCSPEMVWEFTPAGEEAGHYILPTSLAGEIEGIAWDRTTPGGPYLWVLENGRLHRTRLAAEVQIDQTFDFNTSGDRETFLNGLAMDGQNLWVVAGVFGVFTPYGSSLELRKINPINGKLVYVYHQGRVSQFFPQFLTADSQTPGGPYLYWLKFNYVHIMYTYEMKKLSTIPQLWQVIFMPFIYR